MNNKLIFVLLAAIAGLGWFSNNIYNKNTELKKEIVIKDLNIHQLEDSNYSLVFKKGELEEYIKNNNTDLKRKIDSVTKAYNIKLNSIKKVSAVKVKTVVDTVFVPVETVINPVNNLYHSAFSMDSTCFKISGEIIGTDPSPKITFSEVSYADDIYYFTYKEPKKWWQFFKKRKLMLKTVSECGDVTVRELIEE